MVFKLPRFVSSFPIVSENRTPTLTFHRWWQEAIERIETAINGIQDALDAAGIAQATADAAQATADAAQAAADSAESMAKLTNSGTTGVTLTATDAGSDATVSVTAHTRIYGDNTNVSVNAGSVTGLAYETYYYIYYDDPNFTGGAVTYAATTDSSVAAQVGSRHLVGSVVTPAALGGDTGGNPVVPPGQEGLPEP